MLLWLKDAGAADFSQSRLFLPPCGCTVNGSHLSSAENAITRLKQLKTINILRKMKGKNLNLINLIDKIGPDEMRKKNNEKTITFYLSARKNNFQSK